MARNVFELEVGSQEQSLNLLNGYSVDIFFDRCYKRWYYNLYYVGNLVAAGVALNADTAPLLGYIKESLALAYTGDPKQEYEPFEELGQLLSLMEVSE